MKNCIVDTVGSDLTFLSTDGWFERGHDHMEGEKIGWDGHWWPTIDLPNMCGPLLQQQLKLL
jgi:hypothetical protein